MEKYVKSDSDKQSQISKSAHSQKSRTSIALSVAKIQSVELDAKI